MILIKNLLKIDNKKFSFSLILYSSQENFIIKSIFKVITKLNR